MKNQNNQVAMNCLLCVLGSQLFFSQSTEIQLGHDYDQYPFDPYHPDWPPKPTEETGLSLSTVPTVPITIVTTSMISTAITKTPPTSQSTSVPTTKSTSLSTASSTSTSSKSATTSTTNAKSHKTCKETLDENGATWPLSNQGECSISSPLCIDDSMEVTRRCCTEAGWADPPECLMLQPTTISDPCPSDLKYHAEFNLCVVVTEESTYPPECPYEEVVIFANYKSLKGTLTDKPIWLPILRDVGKYGIGQLLWREPSNKYKMSYTACTGSCENFYYSGSILDKNCMVYHNNTYAEAVSCDEKYSAICAYKTIHTRVHTLCSQSGTQETICKQSDYSTRSKCFCESDPSSENAVVKAEFLLSYQNLLYPTMSSAECYIGLAKIDDQYVWTASNTPITYTWWSSDAVFDQGYKYGAVIPTGWILKETEQKDNTCTLYQSEPPTTHGSLSLTYSESDEEFTVRITNASNWLYDKDSSTTLVYCFTDAAPTTIIYKVTDIDFSTPTQIENDVYNSFKPLSIVESGPGIYWCEAFLYPYLRVKSSNEFLYRPAAYVGEYVAILRYQYSSDNHPFARDNVSFLQTLLKNDINSKISFFPRMFKIYKVDEDNLELTINFHFSSTKSNGTYEEYLELLMVLQQLDQFTLEEFLSVDFCVGAYTNNSAENVYWPITPVNSIANPEGGLCLSDQGSFINRYCYGNFTDGAKWSVPITPCTFYESSNITVNLTNIINSDFSSDILQQLVELTERYCEFVALDVYLVSVILESFLIKIDLNSLTTVVNNVMKVPHTVLNESQSKLLATDRILYYVDEITKNSNEEGKFIKDSFAIISLPLENSNFQGISVTQCSNSSNCLITILQSDDITNGVLSSKLNESIHGSFILSNKLITQILKKSVANATFIPRIIVTVYNNSSLFNENNKRINSSIIFGIILPDFKEDFLGPISFLFYTADESPEDFNCSYWEYNVETRTNGYWEYQSDKNVLQNFVLCEFWHLTHIGVVDEAHDVETNITVRLLDIKRSQVNIQQKLEKTNSLTEQYSNFTAVDVNLVAEIVSQAQNVSRDELYFFTSILNNIMNVPIFILTESRDQYKSIDKLLDVYGKLFHNIFNESYYVNRDNLISFVLSNNNTSFGMLLDNCESICTTSFIAANDNITDLYNNNNFDLGLVVTQGAEDLEISNNLSCNTAITIFLSDVLFQSSMNYQSIGKTVGINLSDQTCDSSVRKTSLYYGLKSSGLDLEKNYIDCGIWENYQDIWTSNTSGKTVVSDELFKCDVNSTGFFSFVDYDIDKNITLDLLLLLNSSESITITELDAMLSLTAIYWRLSAVDIYIVSEILSKVTTVDDNILISIANILSNLMIVNRDVLILSHRDYNATERIKQFFHDLSIKYTGEILIKTNNLALVILSLENNDVSTISLKFYTGHYDIDLSDEIVATPEIDSGIKISEDLIAQIKTVLNGTSETPRIVLSIYFRDTLFNDKLNGRTTSRIYSLLIPGFTETFINPVSIYFNMSDLTNYTSCVTWSSEYYWKFECKNSTTSTFLECNGNSSGQFASVEKNNVTDVITEISKLNATVDNVPCKLREVTALYYKYTADDVNNLVKILNYLTFVTNTELKTFSDIINNILQIPRHILRESQLRYYATDRLLQRIVEILNVTAEPFPTLYKNDFFAFNVWNPKENTNLEQFGFIIYQNSTVTFIWKGQENDIDFDQLDSLLLVSDELLTQLRSMNSCKVIVTIYFNDAFFSEGSEYDRRTSNIFGLTVPDFHDRFDGRISLLQTNHYYNKHFECAFWEYGTSFEDFQLQGYWNVDGNLKNTTQNFTTCDYWGPHSNYAYVENKGSNVTLLLKAILESNKPSSAKLSDLNNVLAFYSRFSPTDVELTTQILTQIQNLLSHEIECLVSVVNAIMNVPSYVLRASQKKFRSTDKILQNVDRLLTSSDLGDVLILDKENENFAAIVTTLNYSSDFRGISIFSYGSKNVVFYIKTVIIDNNIGPTVPTFEAAVLISPNLLAQLMQESLRVIITVYYTDALFIEQTPDVSVDGVVFGVLLPDLNDDMDGHISLMFPKEESEGSPFYRQPACSYWQFFGNTTLTSSWQEDVSPEEYDNYISCDYHHVTHFALVKINKNITTDLEDILHSDKTGQEKLDMVHDITSTKYLHLIAVDIYLISEILIGAVRDLDTVNVSRTAEIVSTLFNVPRNVLNQSQTKYNATDMILHCMDEIGRTVNETQASYENFAFMVTDLVSTSVTGVILSNCTATLCNITYTYDRINLTEYASDDNIGAAVIFSEGLLNQIKERNAGKVVISVYYSDVLFNENNRSRNTTRIFGVDLPDFTESFEGNITVVHNTGQRSGSGDNCAYWNFNMDSTNYSNILPGEWVEDSGSELNNLLSICEYSHITNFALLLADEESDITNSFSLDLITNINCCLSIFGILGIILTSVLFEKWRKNTGNQILINFAIAISINMGMLYVSTFIYQNSRFAIICTISGSLLHYAILAEFCWMLIIAILQFKRFVEVLGGRPKYVLLKALVCGWIFPMFPVLCVLLIDPDNYQSNTVGLCYPSDLGLYLGIWLPIVIIIIINLVIFIFIVYNVFHKKTQCPETVNHEILFQWRLALLLFFMLGLTWIFGFLGQIKGSYVFTYLFCFSATLQGFIMFLFFIVFNKSTRFLYSQWIRYWLYSKGYLIKK